MYNIVLVTSNSKGVGSLAELMSKGGSDGFHIFSYYHIFSES